MFQNVGLWDWVIILVIVLLFFGGKRLPELAKSLGKSISAFKKGVQEGIDEPGSKKDDPPGSGPKPS